jgi:hypothetical protein
MLSGIVQDSPTQPTVLYAFDVKVRPMRLGHACTCMLIYGAQVFGVTAFKFFDRYSRLRSVHDDMLKDGCFGPDFQASFPPKQAFASVASDVAAQKQRGHQLLQYYAALFTDATVMNHPATQGHLKFSAVGIDKARQQRKDVLAGLVPEEVRGGVPSGSLQ